MVVVQIRSNLFSFSRRWLVVLPMFTLMTTACKRTADVHSSARIHDMSEGRSSSLSCPHSTELQDLRLPDGSIAKVVILSVGEVKLYIPMSWLDRPPGSEYGVSIRYLAANPHYRPPVLANECPGIVHVFSSSSKPFGLVWNIAIRSYNSEPTVMPNFSNSSAIDKIALTSPQGAIDPTYGTGREFTEQISPYPSAMTPSAYMVAVPNVLMATVPWRLGEKVESPLWMRYKSSVQDLVQWLRTPPRVRDNDRVFVLGGPRD